MYVQYIVFHANLTGDHGDSQVSKSAQLLPSLSFTVVSDHPMEGELPT
jgi:hypothetical protein